MMRTKLALFAAVALMAPLASAGMIEINMAGTNLTYTDADAGGGGLGTLVSTGGTDALQAVGFSEDLAPLGVFSSPPDSLSFSLNVTDVPSIAVPPSNGSTMVTAPAGGTFDLTVNANSILSLSLESVQVIYTNIEVGSFKANVWFTGSVGSISGQDLPFGIEIGEPVTLSFTVQPISQVASGGYLTSFVGGGSGTISAERIPEPSSLLIAGLGLLAVAGVRARSKK